MLVDPIKQVTYCLKQLFTNFRLSWIFQDDEETLYLKEYLPFIEALRRSHPVVQQPKLLIMDAVEFITRQDAMKSRRYLTRIFRLRCLCLVEPQFSFPAVRFGSVNTDDATWSLGVLGHYINNNLCRICGRSVCNCVSKKVS